ncbi:TPA: hypothetical protein DIV45_00440 [Patescibacteria group bacterium]|uniref:Subtilisin-like protein serine protease n=1 Tax=candidate division Kazan bacterium GW2011_GWA1_44_22 TaxID=1620410 RepID=A0A0G1HZW4_UNCK3|nr:MAG: Subtilisin-like protein serine protease [candidate division Kazan bacterium GW2011_GWA1_44_22]HCR41833.1 hypothetical protein [Patescibacteria group bacterium]
MDIKSLRQHKFFKVFSTTIIPVAVLAVVVIGINQTYTIIRRSQAAGVEIPEYGDHVRVSVAGKSIYQNINKEKYGDVDQFEAATGELLVRLKAGVPSYEIAVIANRYGMDILTKYRRDYPSYRLRFSNLKTPDQESSRINPGSNRLPTQTNPLTVQQIPNLQNPAKTIEQIWQELDANPIIYSVVPNSVFYLEGEEWDGGFWPNDKLMNSPAKPGNKEELQLIGAHKAWQILLDKGYPAGGREEIWTAVIDQGVDLDHPDLRDNIAKDDNGVIVGASFDLCEEGKYNEPCDGWIYLGGESGGDGIDNDGDNLVDEATFHGTVVAGIIAETGENISHSAGVAFNTKIVPINVSDKQGDEYGNIYHDAMIMGIDYAATLWNVKVINLSLGGYITGPDLESVVHYAYGNGKIIVAGAGNHNSSIKMYPAGIDEVGGINRVIAVAATDINGNRASYSNFGDWVDISAIGDNITSTAYDDAYLKFAIGGTSFATPQVSGVVALLLSAYPSLIAQTSIIKTIIQRANTIYYPDANKTLGCGVVNAGFTLVSRAPLIKSPDCITRFILGQPIELSWSMFIVGPPPDSYRIWWGLENGAFYVPNNEAGVDVGSTTSYTLASRDMEAYWDGTWTWRVAAVYNKDQPNEEVRWTQPQTIKKHTGAWIDPPIGINPPTPGVVGPGYKFDWEDIENINNYIGELTCPNGYALIAKNDTISEYTLTGLDFTMLQQVAGSGICELSVVGTALGDNLSWDNEDDRALMRIPVQGAAIRFYVAD